MGNNDFNKNEAYVVPAFAQNLPVIITIVKIRRIK